MTEEIIKDSDILRIKDGGESDDNLVIANDEVLREWAYGKRVLHLADEQDFPITWSSEFATKEDFFKRFSLFAELVSDSNVSLVKRNILLSMFYERLRLGLSWLHLNADTLEWCNEYCKETYHPAVHKFCEDAKMMLTNLDKYNPKVFDFYKWSSEEQRKITS